MIFMVVLGWTLLIISTAATATNVNIQKAIAVGGATTTAIVSQSPIYTEIDNPTNQKAVVVNGTIHATEVTFSGHGTAKGVNFTDSGKGLIIARGNTGIIGSKGQVAMMTSSGEKASATFEEIGHPDANGTITASGAAFFDANATGKLASLGNAVAIYKDQIYKNGEDKVIAWEWK
jgi:hypothetical protein